MEREKLSIHEVLSDFAAICEHESLPTKVTKQPFFLPPECNHAFNARQHAKKNKKQREKRERKKIVEYFYSPLQDKASSSPAWASPVAVHRGIPAEASFVRELQKAPCPGSEPGSYP